VREAVRRINATAAYLHYFIDYPARPIRRSAALNVEDLRESRLVVCDPAPIPLDEMQRTYEWLKSWGMLEETARRSISSIWTCSATPIRRRE